MNAYIIGKLIVAGDYPADEQIGGQPLARAVVVMPSDALKAVKRLPMYKNVAVVELEKVITLERRNAALVKVLIVLAQSKDVPNVTVSELAEYAQRAVDAATDKEASP